MILNGFFSVHKQVSFLLLFLSERYPVIPLYSISVLPRLEDVCYLIHTSRLPTFDT